MFVKHLSIEISKDDKILLRQQVKDNNSCLINLLNSHKKTLDLSLLQIQLRRILAAIKSKQNNSQNPGYMTTSSEARKSNSRVSSIQSTHRGTSNKQTFPPTFQQMLAQGSSERLTTGGGLDKLQMMLVIDHLNNNIVHHSGRTSEPDQNYENQQEYEDQQYLLYEGQAEQYPDSPEHPYTKQGTHLYYNKYNPALELQEYAQRIRQQVTAIDPNQNFEKNIAKQIDMELNREFEQMSVAELNTTLPGKTDILPDDNSIDESSVLGWVNQPSMQSAIPHKEDYSSSNHHLHIMDDFDQCSFTNPSYKFTDVFDGASTVKHSNNQERLSMDFKSGRKEETLLLFGEDSVVGAPQKMQTHLKQFNFQRKSRPGLTQQPGFQSQSKASSVLGPESSLLKNQANMWYQKFLETNSKYKIQEDQPSLNQTQPDDGYDQPQEQTLGLPLDNQVSSNGLSFPTDGMKKWQHKPNLSTLSLNLDKVIPRISQDVTVLAGPTPLFPSQLRPVAGKSQEQSGQLFSFRKAAEPTTKYGQFYKRLQLELQDTDISL